MESKAAPERSNEVCAKVESAVLPKLERDDGLPAKEAQRGNPRLGELFCPWRYEKRDEEDRRTFANHAASGYLETMEETV